MDIITVNAETKLAQVSLWVLRSPQSWYGWSAMRIAFDDFTNDAQEDGFYCAKSILESYLHTVEGRAYYIGHTLHVLCKNVPQSVLDQACTQICELSGDSEKNYQAKYTTYHLETQADKYAKIVELDCPEHFAGESAEISPEETKNYFDELSAHDGVSSISGISGLASKKVLLIEDDPVTRWMVRNALKDECDFLAAPTANKAYALYTSFRPDIIFLDINLPDKSGYSVLQWIMRNDPKACVVMFSGNSSLDHIIGALEKGACGFITKPFVQDNLTHYIRGRIH